MIYSGPKTLWTGPILPCGVYIMRGRTVLRRQNMRAIFAKERSHALRVCLVEEPRVHLFLPKTILSRTLSSQKQRRGDSGDWRWRVVVFVAGDSTSVRWGWHRGGKSQTV